MKYKLLVQTFNGIKITPEVDIFVALGKGKNILPLGIYKEIQNEIINVRNIPELDFFVFSKDLENLIQQNMSIDYNNLKTIILKQLFDLHSLL